MAKDWRPFSNGTSYGFWTERNCDNCAKDSYDKPNGYWCPLQEALNLGYVGDGTIPEEIARRLGMEKRGDYPSLRCPEFEPLPAAEEGDRGTT